jgi:hypothetical protein
LDQFTSEFMIEDDVDLNDCTGFDFVSHHSIAHAQQRWRPCDGLPLWSRLALHRSRSQATFPLRPATQTVPNEVRNLFAAMEANVGASWPDPAGLGPPVSDQMTPDLVNSARRALQEAQRKATLAMRAEETGRQGEALRIWHEVLGDYFPLS